MSEHSISWWRTEFGEPSIEAVANAIRRERIGQGLLTQTLENDLAARLKVKHAVVVTSGSVALYLALMAKGVGPGDEVIVPDRTWVASAHAPYMAGAKPVLAETIKDAPVMDCSRLEQLITPRTKAIMPVHLNGRGCDMARINSLAKAHGLVVIEDACQALFSQHPDGSYMGTNSDAGCFSLGTTKLISSGQGGVIITNDTAYYEKLRLVKNHGVVDQFTDRWNQFGMNFKFTDIQAAIAQQHLDTASERIAHVRLVHERYTQGLKDIDCIRLIPFIDRHELPLYADAISPVRDELIEYLRGRNIQSRPFPPSLHTTSYLHSGGAFPNSAFFNTHGLYLPCGPSQPLENVDRVIEELHLFNRRARDSRPSQAQPRA